jgi:hypothetical protein
MTKGELIELVKLRVDGGKLSNNTDTHRAVISKLLGPAIKEATLIHIRDKRTEELTEKRLFGIPGSNVAEHLLVTHEVTAETHPRGKVINLGFKIQDFPGNRGIDSLSNFQGDCQFVLVKSQKQIVGVDPPGGAAFYWYEIYPEGGKVFLKGYNGDSTLLLRVAFDADSYGDNDVLPLPFGWEMRIIDRIVDYFIKQRTTPIDEVNDDTDDIHKSGQGN